MPHTVIAATAKLAPGLGVSRGQPVPERKRAVRKNVSTRTSSASSLITAPVLTELVKLTLSPSSVTNANTVAAGRLIRSKLSAAGTLFSSSGLSYVLRCLQCPKL